MSIRSYIFRSIFWLRYRSRSSIRKSVAWFSGLSLPRAAAAVSRGPTLVESSLKLSRSLRNRNYPGILSQDTRSWSWLCHGTCPWSDGSLRPTILRTSSSAYTSPVPSLTAAAYNGWLSRFQAFTMSTCWFSLRLSPASIGQADLASARLVPVPRGSQTCWPAKEDYTSPKWLFSVLQHA
jgi:hypothetical protein